MVRIALAPCSPFSVTPELMVATAELARESRRPAAHAPREDPTKTGSLAKRFGRRTIEQFEEVGWGSDRAWVAHCIYPNEDEIARLGKWGTGVAHCPSSNMLIGGGGIAPVAELRAAGAPVGLGCDGSASTDSASLWMEARNALLLGRLRNGPTSMGARDALEIATRGSARCLGRAGELGQLSPERWATSCAGRSKGVQFARVDRSRRSLVAMRTCVGAPHGGTRQCRRPARNDRAPGEADMLRHRAISADPGRLTNPCAHVDSSTVRAALEQFFRRRLRFGAHVVDVERERSTVSNQRTPVDPGDVSHVASGRGEHEVRRR